MGKESRLWRDRGVAEVNLLTVEAVVSTSESALNESKKLLSSMVEIPS